jgi:TRIAD3 protein (E3 ubiquitin-protein ligase RNF216)
MPVAYIRARFVELKYLLFPTYQFLDDAQRNFDPRKPAYQKIKTARKINRHYLPDAVQAALISEVTTPAMKEVFAELVVAQKHRDQRNEERRAKELHDIAEAENEARAIAEGTMGECGCCYGDYPLNRMIHCNSETTTHFFCKPCAKQNAETEIGKSKYELICMSTNGCAAGFDRAQKALFLDEANSVALDRIEQETMLRMAGIENLESCPFCPFAAEYPPVEEDRLFHCQAPDCEKISCRLCRLESHVPKTCEEFAKANGLSIRRQIEEAMSAAMIRKCNKCNTPFVKEEGCNKMSCTSRGCDNIQCYVCSKSCDYSHFDNAQRGGKAGNCPLFDNVNERHKVETDKAYKDAIAKVVAEHPEYTEDDLKIQVSDAVKMDEKRKADAAYLRLHPHERHGPVNINIQVGIHNGRQEQAYLQYIDRMQGRVGPMVMARERQGMRQAIADHNRE